MAGKAGRSGGPRPGSGRPKGSKNVVRTRVRLNTDAGPTHWEPTNFPDGSMAGPRGETVDILNIPTTDSPLAFLLAAMNNPLLDPKARIRAAVTVAQYVAVKRKDGGKKDEEHRLAESATQEDQLFAPAAPPRLIAVK